MKQYDKVIRLLRQVEQRWPPELMLMSNNGLLELYLHDKGKPITCIATFRGIRNDGGDFGTVPDAEEEG